MEELRFVKKEPINKGWSGDKKYCLTNENGEKFLLRISLLDEYDKKRLEFNVMEKVFTLGGPMCRPIKFGACTEGVYSLQSWIDGEDAEKVIPALPDERQYKYGLKAGQILKKIHSIPTPKGQEEWESRFNRKMDRYIRRYNESTVKYPNGDGEALMAYISANRHLLSNRPQCFQHGDYHTGNMMIDGGGQLTIIDFNRADFGDPWEEFNRIVWCAQLSPAFASGMVDGYFNGTVPMEFWRLLALYIASNTLGSIVWAIPFGQEEIDVMLRQEAEIMAWYDHMRDPVPTWYRKEPGL